MSKKLSKEEMEHIKELSSKKNLIKIENFEGSDPWIPFPKDWQEKRTKRAQTFKAICELQKKEYNDKIDSIIKLLNELKRV